MKMSFQFLEPQSYTLNNFNLFLDAVEPDWAHF